MSPAKTNLLLFGLVLALPVVIFILWSRLPALSRVVPAETPLQTSFPKSSLRFKKSTLGHMPSEKPLITHVRIEDLDQDGLADVLVCDAVLNRVVWYRQTALTQWEEHVLAETDLAAPSHASTVDLDGDNDLDIVVAVLGSVYPADEPIGKVVWLKNDGRQNFTTHVLLDDLRRVADVSAGDLNGDGMPDLVVAEFGYDRGRILWLENQGKGQFRDQELYVVPGAIHVPLVDLNGDGKLDVVTIVSQEDEEVIAFENLGKGRFQRRSLYVQSNFDFGSSGLFVTDLNQDGQPDLLLTAGDNLEITQPAPQPWHGCFLLENRGHWEFQPRRLATVPGVYAAAAGDLNGDQSLDIVLVSMFNDWHNKESCSVVCLENDGKGNFSGPWQIANAPSHLATVSVGDLNRDGQADIVAGSLHLQGPFDRLGRVTLWNSVKERSR